MGKIIHESKLAFMESTFYGKLVNQSWFLNFKFV